METKTGSFKEKIVITANAMNTLCIEDVLVALRLFVRRHHTNCPELALGCDRNGSSFWLTREPNGAITISLQSEP